MVAAEVEDADAGASGGASSSLSNQAMENRIDSIMCYYHLANYEYQLWARRVANSGGGRVRVRLLCLEEHERDVLVSFSGKKNER